MYVLYIVCTVNKYLLFLFLKHCVISFARVLFKGKNEVCDCKQRAGGMVKRARMRLLGAAARASRNSDVGWVPHGLGILGAEHQRVEMRPCGACKVYEGDESLGNSSPHCTESVICRVRACGRCICALVHGVRDRSLSTSQLCCHKVEVEVENSEVFRCELARARNEKHRVCHLGDGEVKIGRFDRFALREVRRFLLRGPEALGHPGGPFCFRMQRKLCISHAFIYNLWQRLRDICKRKFRYIGEFLEWDTPLIFPMAGMDRGQSGGVDGRTAVVQMTHSFFPKNTVLVSGEVTTSRRLGRLVSRRPGAKSLICRPWDEIGFGICRLGNAWRLGMMKTHLEVSQTRDVGRHAGASGEKSPTRGESDSVRFGTRTGGLETRVSLRADSSPRTRSGTRAPQVALNLPVGRWELHSKAELSNERTAARGSNPAASLVARAKLGWGNEHGWEPSRFGEPPPSSQTPAAAGVSISPG